MADAKNVGQWPNGQWPRLRMRGNLNVGASVQSHYFVEESDKIVSNDVVLVYGIVEMYSNIALAVMFRLCLSILHTPNALRQWLRG